MNRQVQIKAEQIARLVIQGVPGTKIALMMGMSYDGLRRVMRTEEYLQIEAEARKSILGQMDAKLLARMDVRKKMAEEMEDDAVPESWKIVLENLRKKRDLKTALEILDRDPKRQFAKTGKPQETEVVAATPARPALDKSILEQAVKEADVTHNILTKTQAKPAEA